MTPSGIDIYIYICVCVCVCVCKETVYELPLLLHNSANETFLHKSGAAQGADWIFISGVQAWR